MEALGQFVAWLGSFAGDAALLFGARGGVYLGGGIVPKMIDALSTGIFLSAFLFLTGGLGIAWPVVLLVDGLSEATRHWLGSLCLVLTFIALRVLMIWFSRWRSTPEQRDQDYQAFLAGEG